MAKIRSWHEWHDHDGSHLSIRSGPNGAIGLYKLNGNGIWQLMAQPEKENCYLISEVLMLTMGVEAFKEAVAR